TTGKTASIQGKPGMNTESSMEHAECTQSSRKMTNSLEQKIRCLEKQRKELLEVNRQWDQQFRSMKELYERKVAELKTKLAVAERVLGTLETEPQSRRERAGQHDLTRGPPPREELVKTNKLLSTACARECGLRKAPRARGQTVSLELAGRGRPPTPRFFWLSKQRAAIGLQFARPRQEKEVKHRFDVVFLEKKTIFPLLLFKEKECLNEELEELKKENKLLKEKNILATKKKEHYECEIKRLNKVLQDVLKIESSSFSEDCSGQGKVECNHAEMRTEMEVLKHQVQIYEEDFRKERSDRERLNQEKEELQQINQTSQSQLNRLSSQIKSCQMEKEKLEKQLKQMHFPTCKCSLVFHMRDPWVPTGTGAAQDPQEHPPDYQWYALDQLPPDVQHKAN
uniref:TNFAIP3-interacting protein 3 n=1 Tax=Castor canadensis TaxID=51338 RepID=A0A8B7TSX6_CASCN